MFLNKRKKFFLSSPKDIFSLLFRERRRESQKHWCKREAFIGSLPLVCTQTKNLGLNMQPRHVPWLGIGPASLRLPVHTPTNWATLAKVRLLFLLLFNHPCRHEFLTGIIYSAHKELILAFLKCIGLLQHIFLVFFYLKISIFSAFFEGYFHWI